MKKDIIPINSKKLSGWAELFKKSIAASGSGVGLTPADIADIGQLCDEIVEQRKVRQEAFNHSKAMGKLEKEIQGRNVPKLRKYIRKIKVNSTSSTQLVGLGIKPHNNKPEEENYQAQLKLRVVADMIEVKFKKYGVDRFEFYGSCNGGPYHKLDTRSRSPFTFKPDPLPEHLPQRWNIYATAIYKDKEFGKKSAIYTILYESALEYGI